MNWPATVRIVEVGPRDGLQNEALPITTASRVELVARLANAGLRHIEVAAFVAPKAVPQMADSPQLMAALQALAWRAPLTLSALVPNERGMVAALEARAQKVAVFAAASEEFSQRNTGAPIAQVLERFVPVVALARGAGIPVRGYISCVVRCPYAGPTAPAAVRSVAQQLLALGVDEIDLGDTIGVAQPDDIARLYEGLAPVLAPGATTLHLHDTNGRAIDNARRALEMGVRSFDASAGGLGGCPFAPGAQGNVSTSALLGLLAELGYETRVDAAAVARATSPIFQLLRADAR